MAKVKRKVMVELRPNKDLAEMAVAATARVAAAAAVGAATVAGPELDTSAVPKIAGLDYDPSYPPTQLFGRRPRTQALSVLNPVAFDLMDEPEAATFLVRAEVDEAKVEDVTSHRNVVGVYSDLVIEPQVVGPNSGPLGTAADVERLLCCAGMRGAGMDGAGVLVAVVDTGINLAHLTARGKAPVFDAARSLAIQPGTPGSMPVGHGTMCAFDVCIAAPRCTLLDIAILPTVGVPLTALLSDAVRAYQHLMQLMTAPRRPGDNRSLVVSNSWAVFQAAADFPPGHPSNYTDNLNHPFNRIVADLERAGADILFAAGNCGGPFPDQRCAGVTTAGILGANGHPSVLSVGGVDTTKVRAGYSSTGPGRLTRNKPDVCGYTHFQGSGVFAADGGTSAATPVVAGVVAAVRSKRPLDANNPSTHPAAIRSLITTTAQDLGTAGFDLEHGFGVVDGCELVRQVGSGTVPPLPPGGSVLCQLFPQLCPTTPGSPPTPPAPLPGQNPTLCQLFPQLCPATPAASPLAALLAGAAAGAGGTADPLEAAFAIGYRMGAASAGAAPPGTPRASGCGCSGK